MEPRLKQDLGTYSVYDMSFQTAIPTGYDGCKVPYYC